MASSSTKSSKDEPPSPSFQLTEEEKAVLLECRRNSIARGLPLGVASVLALRWFVLTGRAPLHVQRWRGLYYGGVFLGTFLYGVNSYRDVCFKKIMALENSNLADQVRKHMKDVQTIIDKEMHKGHENSRRVHRQQQQQQQYPPISNQRNRVPLSPPTQPSESHVHLNEGPSINQRGYSRDKAQLSNMDQEVQQPDAFGGGTTLYSDVTAREEEEQPVVTAAKKRGRTFDEIREENRRRQLEQNFPRSSRLPTKEPGSGGRGDEQSSRDYPQTVSGKRPLRKNKYGDDVYED